MARAEPPKNWADANELTRTWADANKPTPAKRDPRTGMSTATISAFIANLPKAELHMHLEGSLEAELLIKLAARNGVRLPYGDAEALRRAYRFDSLTSVVDLFLFDLTVLNCSIDFCAI